MGEGFFKVVAFSLMLLFLLPMLNHSGMSDTSEQLSVNQENDNYRSISSNNKSDAWLNLELLSWQGNSSTTWDTDGTDMDVQFQVCIDLDGDSDGISPLCTWTEVWNNTLTLSNAWETTFDLIEDNTTLNITIECWDNDEFADEWGNGPDACDLNPDDDEWRLYYEANWSNITTETFSGDGSIGNDTQWGNAESTWKVTVSYYGDEDNDGVSDNVDGCEDTVIGDESDSAGCSWEQYDWDSDGIVNSEDQCPTSVEIYCSAGNQYLPTTKVTFTNNQIAESSVGSRAWDISPDGKHLAVIVDGNSLSQQRVGGGLVVFRLDQSFEFTKNGIGEIIAGPLYSCGDEDQQRVKYTSDGEKLILSGLGCVEFYDTESYSLLNRTEFPADGEYCPESDDSWRWLSAARITLSQNNRFAKFECPHEDEMIYIDLSSFEIVSVNDLDSIESRGEFIEFENVYPYLLPNGIIAQWHSDGFELITPNSENSLVVDLETTELVQFSAPNDGNTLLVASHDWAQPGYHSSNERLTILNLSTGQEISIQMPNVPEENVKFKAAQISQNGLTIAIFYAGEIHVYERDSDLDGFVDSQDICPWTQGELSGCLEEYFDTDEDGVNDKDDQCPGTLEGIDVDSTGCALNQIDSDGDGISDATDQCPNTPNGDSVGLTGCSSSQTDSDEDGINDSQDICPGTPSGMAVDNSGCAANQLDSDGDGINDSQDICPGTSSGMAVDNSGCAANQRDGDGDGINDSQDICPDTSSGMAVDNSGCAANQRDSDGDRISDATDECPNTPNGQSVGLAGCSSSQIDSDGDGITDSNDDCPNSLFDSTVDASGCAQNDVVDLDSDEDGVRDSADTCPNTSLGVVVDSTGCETSGDFQVANEKVQSEDFEDLEEFFYGCCGIIFLLVILAGVISVIKSVIEGRDTEQMDWDYGRSYNEDGDDYTDHSYENLSQNISVQHPESNLELQNIMAELERQRQHSEQEINRLRQQQLAQQSNATEMAVIQKEMLALQLKVAESEQAKLQLQRDVENAQSQQDTSIRIQDSAVSGDIVSSGGQKVESLTNVVGTDPETIAKIIFEAQEKVRNPRRGPPPKSNSKPPKSSLQFVETWEELPPGEWLDNDKDGIHWYLTDDGVHWRSTDGGYEVYNE